jgi:hypothetical protein
MNDLKRTIEERFPLLATVRIYRDADHAEDLATFMGILLAAIEEARFSPFCFVFPRKDSIAPLCAVLYALGKFAVDFPKLAEQYAERSFQKGQRVRLNPAGKVFEFGGLWPGFETRFRLELLNEKAAFTWPVTEILRIEPTNRKIPKGHFIDGDRARKEMPRSSLDKLIGVNTFGNNSLARNHVLYLGGRTEFDDFLAGTSLVSAESEVPSTIDTVVSVGFLDASGAIRHRDQYQTSGEPLIAFSSRVDHIAAACSKAPQASKVVIIDDARRITDLAKFDIIAANQNVIIVAGSAEEDKLRQLHDRGCRFWRFSLEDLEIDGHGARGGQFFSRTFRSAANEAAFTTDTITCQNSHLELCSIAMERCEGSLEESETDDTRLLLGQMYGVLMQCAGMLTPPDPDERIRLIAKMRVITTQADERRMWLPDTPADALSEACATLQQALEDSELGMVKGLALKELVKSLRLQGKETIGVVARSTSHRHVSRWMSDESLNCPVLLPSNNTGNFFDALICTSWPNAANFNKLISYHAAPLACLIAYPFEGRWLFRFNRRRASIQRVPNLDSSDKTVLLGLPNDSGWFAESAAPIRIGITDGARELTQDFEDRIGRRGAAPISEPGEETLPARLVEFSGEGYAFLTPTVRTPVITDLVAGTAGPSYKIPRRRVEEIQIGDVLVFRNGGRRDVIQALADAQLGKDASAIREKAARWHKALRESGLDQATLMSELEDVNCPRTLQTVRSWLSDDAMIGPQTEEDLEAIAYAVGDQKLLEDVPSIWEAIVRLRSEHLSAGMRLTRILLEKLPEHLDHLREGRARVEINNGTDAWIVQVESVGEREELRPRSHVNTILWEHGDLDLSSSWQK